MRTRNAEIAKPFPPSRKQQARKNAVRTTPATSEVSAEITEMKHASAANFELEKVNEAFLAPTSSSGIRIDQPSEEESAPPAEAGAVVKSIDIKVKDDQVDIVGKATNDEVRMVDDDKFVVKHLGSSWLEQKTVDLNIAAEEEEEDDEYAENGQNIEEENKNIGKYEKKEENMIEIEVTTGLGAAGPLKQEEPLIMKVATCADNNRSCSVREVAKEELKDNGRKDTGGKKDLNGEDTTYFGEKSAYDGQPANNVNEKSREGHDQTQEQNFCGGEGMEGYSEKLDLGEHREDEDLEEDPEEISEETETLEEERMELTAVAKERKIKKEHEIFVGGLDRDATEEDLKRVFEKVGEVVEVRLHKDPSTNRNKGYAFVKFATKEHAKRALSEMKNPVIHGKRCGTAPSEDNDTLFLGNICNTWTKEAIKQKLKDYGIEGVENITLVPDAQHEGLSRGFAFVEFACHVDAMLAYKRLQKPDAIFGHPDRTAKVAFAEPIREPDPEIMAQVKSVFVDGLPPHWDEDCVREHFKGYGEIEKIVLARNMSTAKRRDFGFIDFSTHEFAVACVNGISNSELYDGSSKVKIRARLSNPLPKTQAVKGGMCGGFRIGHGRSESCQCRGFSQGGRSFHWGNFHHGRNFNRGGRSQPRRMGFQDMHYDNQYMYYSRRQFIPRGGRRGVPRDEHFAPGRGVEGIVHSRPYFDRPWYGVPDGLRSHLRPRRPFSPEAPFDRSFIGRHFEDPYLYDDNMHEDHEPDYMRPTRRPRLNYTEPAPFYPENRFPGSFGTGSSLYSNDYYSSDYGGGPYSNFSGTDAYRRGYYY